MPGPRFVWDKLEDPTVFGDIVVVRDSGVLSAQEPDLVVSRGRWVLAGAVHHNELAPLIDAASPGAVAVVRRVRNPRNYSRRGCFSRLRHAASLVQLYHNSFTDPRRDDRYVSFVPVLLLTVSARHCPRGPVRGTGNYPGRLRAR